MARPKLNCPNCKEEVPALDECVKCGRALPKPAPAREPQRPTHFIDPQPEPPPLNPRKGGTSANVEFIDNRGKTIDPQAGAASRESASGDSLISRWLPWFSLFGFLAALAFFLNFHLVKGGRLGPSYRLVAKETMSLKNSFVNLNDMSPGPGQMQRFREGNPGLLRAVRSVLVAEAVKSVKEYHPSTSEQLLLLRKCYANQHILEGTRTRYFLETAKERNDLGSRGFYDEMIKARLLAGPLPDPGQGSDSWNHYGIDPVTGWVTCSTHGTRDLELGGDNFDYLDFKLLFTDEPLLNSAGTAGITVESSPTLLTQETTKQCLTNLGAVSAALQGYDARFLAGAKAKTLEMATLRDLVARSLLSEIPACPKGQGRFTMRLNGYRGDTPVIFCAIHRHTFP